MLRRLALLTLLGALCACDAPPRDAKPMQPLARDRERAAVPSKEQVRERSGQCAKRSRDRFRRDWKDGSAETADGRMTADFTNHYNAKLGACFYLLTVSHAANDNGQVGASAGTVRKMLFDIDTAELYGEYLGPATDGSPTDAFPTTCRMESLHCGSGREWEALLERYIQE
jgi:hypothetical protein